jgi:hypothetical protein
MLQPAVWARSAAEEELDFFIHDGFLLSKKHT